MQTVEDSNKNTTLAQKLETKHGNLYNLSNNNSIIAIKLPF
jgi:hypothetical protein